MGLSINDALFNLSYWKIAGLWPAIFSGTPGNFKAEYSGLCLSFQAIENPLLQNYANFEFSILSRFLTARSFESGHF